MLCTSIISPSAPQAVAASAIGSTMKEHFGAEDQESIEKVIKADLDKINEELPTYKHILRLNATDKPMIKTTTGKVKRFEEIKNS